MEEKYFVIKEKLEKYNQGQLLNNYNNLNNKEKEELLDEILTINFNQINELYKNTKLKEIKKEVKEEKKKIEPISFIEKEKVSKDDQKEYEQIGQQVIRNSKYAIVTMAGGQRNKIRT